MVTDGYANRLNGVDYNAVDERRFDVPLLMPGGPTSAQFSAKAGRRVNGAGLTVSVGGSPEAWTCSPGAGVIYDPAYASQGAWRFEIPNAKSENLPARPGAGTSRIDLIVARIYDAQAIGSGPVEVKIERINGQAGATPSPPTPPAGSITLELNQLAVPAAGPIVITKSTEVTVAAGGILPVATTAAMNKLKTDGIAYRGLVVDNAQTDSLHRYDGTNFKRLADPSAGLAVVAKRWGADYNPATHVPKRLSWTTAPATTPGGTALIVNDLTTYFAGVASVQITGSGVDTLRSAKGIISGNQLTAYCYGPDGSGVVSLPVAMDVSIDGWV